MTISVKKHERCYIQQQQHILNRFIGYFISSILLYIPIVTQERYFTFNGSLGKSMYSRQILGGILATLFYGIIYKLLSFS